MKILVSSKGNFFVFFICLALVVGLFCDSINTRLISLDSNNQVSHFFFYLYGFLNYTVLLLLAFIFPALLAIFFKLKRLSIIIAWFIVFIGITLLLADTFVYQQFRMHLNLAMLEMTFFGGGQIVEFSPTMLAQICLLVLLCAFIATIAVFIALYAVRKITNKTATIFFLTTIFLFLVCNIVYGIAWAKHYYPVVAVPTYLPLSKPITFNKLLLKTGLMSKEEIYTQPLNQKKNSLMNYPLNPLVCKKEDKPYNFLFIFIDSLRWDMLGPDTMPNAWKFSKKSVVFNDHFSGGINTRHGIFTLFTGIPGSYWHKALTSKSGSALITALQQNNYQIGIFTGAPLNMPEFNQTIFKDVRNLRTFPRGNNVIERDKFAIEDFKNWLNELPKNHPFFSFIFLDNVHANAFPKGNAYEHFKPYLEEINHLKLSNDFDPTPYFNRYKNSVHYADENIGKILNILQDKTSLDNTVVVIGSDHGEEFNDTKLNYWGHNGNFTEYQAKVPLVIFWPGKKPQQINYRTSMLDVVPTILQDALGCTNPINDYSVGQNLFDKNRKRQWVYSSNYSRDAFIEKDRIILINELGLLEFLDNKYRPTKDKKVPLYIRDALKEMSQYVK